MSEYQYYEFQAIDRPLTAKEMDEVSRLSSRTHPTSTRAVFTYSYSDFRGQPEEVLAKYYDAMLYLANWGSKQLAFRVPQSVVDIEALAPYTLDDIITTSIVGDYLIVNVSFYEEEGLGWIEGDGFLSALIQLRDGLMRGDFRYLYLAWLKAAASIVIDEHEWESYDPDIDEIYEYEIGRDHQEPPVPAGLDTLTAPLQAFIDTFEIDADLVTVAAEASPAPPHVVDLDIEALVARLSEAEQIDFLVRVARGEPQMQLQLMKRLHILDQGARAVMSGSASPPSRTIGDLLRATEARRRRRKEEDLRKAEEARLHKLNTMAPVESQLWSDVIALIEEKKAKPYEQAVALLVDLRDLADHLGERGRYDTQLDVLLNQYSTRHGLLRRLREAGLIKNV